MSIRQKLKLFTIILGLLLMGCTAAEPSDTVRFMVFGDPAEFAAYEQLVQAFETGHSTIDVELTHVPSQNDYRERLATEFAAGNPPDVSLMNYRRYASFAAADLLEPLGPYLDDSDLVQPDDFYPVTLQAFTWRGSVMCIPQNISSLVVYYNQDLFDAVGLSYPADDWTWEEFVTTAVALTQDTNGDGQMDQYGVGVEASIFRLAPFIWQNGGEIVDNLENPGELSLAQSPALEALTWFTELQTVHHVVPTRTEEASLDSESRFIEGTTAMYLNSRRGTPTYREIESFTWDIAPLPRNVAQAGILHSDAYCLSANIPNKDAAWTFIEYANSAEGQRTIARSGRTVPSLIEVAQSADFLDPSVPPSRSQVFLDTIDSLRLVPIISTWEEIESVSSEEIERAFYGDIPPLDAARLARDRTREYFVSGEK